MCIIFLLGLSGIWPKHKRSSPTKQAHFGPLLISCCFTIIWLKPVTKSNPKSKSREIYFTYVYGINSYGKRHMKGGTNSIIYHSMGILWLTALNPLISKHQNVPDSYTSLPMLISLLILLGVSDKYWVHFFILDLTLNSLVYITVFSTYPLGD